MLYRTRTLVSLTLASALTFALGPIAAQANEYGHGSKGYGAMGGHGMGMMHGSTGHLIRHLLKHQKEVGLTADQVARLKEMQLNLDRTRIKTEADIQVAERELKALIDDDKSDLSAIEAKLKQSEDLQLSLRLASIKARREVVGLLTPEQRAKEQAEHEKMMHPHKDMGKTRGHGADPHGANPQGPNPHKGMGGAAPSAPGGISVQ